MRNKLVGLAAAMLLAACERPVLADGPLVIGRDSALVCMPTAAAETFTLGGVTLENTSDQTLTLHKVGLSDPNNVTLIESVLLPLPTPTAEGLMALIGYRSPYPPVIEENPNTRADWEARQTAEGTQLGPNVELALVVGVRTLASDASLKSIDIEYTSSSGKRHVAHSTISLVFKPRCNEG